MTTCYLTCPAYQLAAGSSAACLEAARAVMDPLSITVVPSPLLAREAGGGVWLPAEERQADLAAGMAHDILWAARGGYGCMDLVPGLLGRTSARAPLLVGYSDITVLHAIWHRRGWGPSLHGLMPGVPHGERARRTLAAGLAGAATGHSAADLPEVQVLRCGTARGILFPACLTVLASLAGTSAMPDLAGSILAIEDLDERPYRIERCLAQLHLAGCLDGCRGLVAGSFPAALPQDYRGLSSNEILGRWCARLGIPGLAGFPFGHDPDPICLSAGVAATLEVESSTGWQFASAAWHGCRR